MGYTTDFFGTIDILPPLNKEEVKYIVDFSNSRRMDRSNGAYYVDIKDFAQQYDAKDILDENSPPNGQPSLWCDWTASKNGKSLLWNGREKFYHAAEWMHYLIEHFLKDGCLAKNSDIAQFEKFKPHHLNGEIFAKGQNSEDIWKLVVENNNVFVQKGIYPDFNKNNPIVWDNVQWLEKVAIFSSQENKNNHKVKI